MSIEEAIESLNSPGQLATTQFYNIKNNCASVLNATIDAVQTSLVLVAGGGALFPAAPFYLSCEYEVMKCTGKSTDTLTVTRGFDGTTAAAHTAGVIVEQRNNAALWTDLQSAVNNIESGATAIPLNVPDGSITNVKLAPDVSRPSLVQNGAFEQWHRGSGPFVGNQTITADAWAIVLGGSDTLSVSRDTVNAEFGACAACTFTLNGGAGATSLYSSASAIGNGILLSDVIGKQVTFSVRVKASVANTVRVGVYNGAAATYSSFHTGNGTYQTLSVTVNVIAAATIINAGVFFSISCTAYIDNATLVIGAAASNYSPAQIPDVIPNERLSTDVARSNLLTNGGFEIWQRGPGPFTTTGIYCADRWLITMHVGEFITKDAANTDNSAFNLTAATSASSTPGSPTQIWNQRVLENNQIRGKPISFSCRIKTAVANAVRLLIWDGTTGTYSAYHTGNNVYQTLSVTATPNNTPCDVCIQIEAPGTTYIDNAMLVFGTVPADYVPLHPAEDLARCMRYCELWGGVTSEYIGTGLAFSATSGICLVPFKVRKVVVPSVTIGGIAGSGFQAQYGGGSTTVASGVSGSNTGNNGCALSLSGMSGLVAGQAILGVYGTTGFSILIEANP